MRGICWLVLLSLCFNLEFIYYCCWLIFRRKVVSNVVLEKWFGNNFFVFKNDFVVIKEFEILVFILEEICSFELVGFNREGIY